jgi:hypothetical protein
MPDRTPVAPESDQSLERRWWGTQAIERRTTVTETKKKKMTCIFFKDIAKVLQCSESEAADVFLAYDQALKSIMETGLSQDEAHATLEALVMEHLTA